MSVKVLVCCKALSVVCKVVCFLLCSRQALALGVVFCLVAPLPGIGPVVRGLANVLGRLLSSRSILWLRKILRASLPVQRLVATQRSAELRRRRREEDRQQVRSPQSAHALRRGAALMGSTHCTDEGIRAFEGKGERRRNAADPLTVTMEEEEVYGRWQGRWKDEIWALFAFRDIGLSACQR